jgi:hypothetical protein
MEKRVGNNGSFVNKNFGVSNCPVRIAEMERRNS